MKIICNFAVLKLMKGGFVRLLVAGFFIACVLQIYGVTSVVNCNGTPTAFQGFKQRESNAVFLLHQQANYFQMLKTETNLFAGDNSIPMRTTYNGTKSVNSQTFSFNYNNDVQVVTINDEPWFVAADVCRSLELDNVTNALLPLDDDEKLPLILLRAGQQRRVNVISESGLYALMVRSNKPNAKPFRKWVTSEVLPSIRKTGQYATQHSLIDKDREIAYWKNRCDAFCDMLLRQALNQESLSGQLQTTTEMYTELLIKNIN